MTTTRQGTITADSTHLKAIHPWRSMIWATWRQDRAKLFVLSAIFAAVVAILLLTGLRMRQMWANLGLSQCSSTDFASHENANSCLSQLHLFLEQPPASYVSYLVWALHLTPPIIGMFLGAPLIARELESGTFRFAWTQGIGRRRWLTGKLAVIGIVCATFGLIIGFLFSWWYNLFDWSASTGSRWSGQAFDLSLSFAGWTAFSFALGAFIGVLMRRTVAAMAVTGTASAGSALLAASLLRPMLERLDPVIAQRPYMTWHAGELNVGGSWLTDSSGHRLTNLETTGVLRQAGNVPRGQFDQWLTTHHYIPWLSYQPADRFWVFQLIETAILLVLAVVLCVATVRWAHRRCACRKLRPCWSDGK